MDIKQFKAKAKPLGAKVNKVVSAYWGRSWWDTTIVAPCVVITFQFQEDQPLRQVTIGGNSASHATAENLRKTAEIFSQVAELMMEINQP